MYLKVPVFDPTSISQPIKAALETEDIQVETASKGEQALGNFTRFRDDPVRCRSWTGSGDYNNSVMEADG
jgi:hypothetical protein